MEKIQINPKFHGFFGSQKIKFKKKEKKMQFEKTKKSILDIGRRLQPSQFYQTALKFIRKLQNLITCMNVGLARIICA